MNPEIFAKELAKYGFELNEKQKKQFATYYDKLVEFNKKVNLTRITDKNEVYLKHFFDSITPLLEFPDLFKGEKTLCDVGAGAGFPSLPIKILCPNLSITIVDSLGKRLKFLDELVNDLGLDKVTLVTDELAQTVEPLKEQSEIAKKYLEYKKDLEELEISLATYDITKMHEEYSSLVKKIEELNSQKEELELASNKDTTKTENYRLLLIQIEEKVGDCNTKLLSLYEEISKLNSEKTLVLERQKYEVDQVKIDDNILQLKEQEVSLQTDVAVSQEDVKKLENKIMMLRNEVADIEEKLSMLSIKMRHSQSDYEMASRNNFIIKNKIQLLEANIEQDATLPSAVKNVLNHPRLKGIYSTIGKLIQVSEDYVTAIDTALGASANFIVVDDEKSAKEAIEYLKNNKLGRATFFPLNVIQSRFIPASEKRDLANYRGFCGIASELVQYDAKFANIIENQLGNVLVVSNIDALNEIGRKTNYKYRIVSLDGEILHTGGSLTGGSLKKQTSTLKEKQELQSLKIELENNEQSIKVFENKRSSFLKEKESLTSSLENLQKQLVMEVESLEQKQNTYHNLKMKLDNVQKELMSANNLKEGSSDTLLLSLMDQISEKEITKELLEKEMEELRKQKSEISSEIAHLDAIYREKNSEFHKVESELKKNEIELGKFDTKMDYLLNMLSEEYHMTYERAKMEYILELEPEVARHRVTSLKRSMKELGDVNLGSISEYERLRERYDFLMSQKIDLESASNDLYNIIDEMDSIMKGRLEQAFEKIKNEFSVVFKKMFKGGVGILKLTDPDNILETGIEIIAEPPGKKLNNIQLLSGGEKTLTAISLLFAILNVYPVPFCILDEVEAALDEANVDTFGAYLQEQKEKSEFLLITHKKRTMEYASTLYGITMQEQGVSKIVSVSLEEKN